jgi:hypothetical protein
VKIIASLANVASLVALSFFACSAIASENRLVRNIVLKSTQGLEIYVSASLQESEPDAWGNQTRHLNQFNVRTSEFGEFRAVIVLKCTAFRYPNLRHYESTFQMDATQSTQGAPYLASDFSDRQIAYAGFGGDRDSCRTELAIVKNGIWQRDPVNGTNNFVLEL